MVGLPARARSADITARVLANGMSQILGQQFVVENQARRRFEPRRRISSRGRRRTATRSSSVPPPIITNAAINPNLSFDIAKDFAPIALVTSVAVILVVHPSTGVNSVQELIALAKSKPGEVLYASTGVGTAPHLSGELFAMRAGVKLVHVPYQGSPQAVTDLLAGRITMMFSPASAVIAPGRSRQAQGARLGGRKASRASRPICRPWRKPACRTSTPASGSAWWRRRARRARSSTSSHARSREAQQSDDVAEGLQPQGFEPISGGPEVFAKHHRRARSSAGARSPRRRA